MKPQLARALALGAVTGVFLLHLALTVYNMPPRLIVSGEPVTSFDYDTHYEQTMRVLEALRGWGKGWAWDHRMLAGYPTGTLFDPDNKGVEVFCWALTGIGVPLPVAFNLFVFLTHLLPPLCIFAAARLMRLGTGASATAAFLASMLWNFDTMTRWCWWVGMISYAHVTYLVPLIVALFLRFCRERRWRFIVPFTLLMAWAHLAHPYVFVALLVPLGAIWARHARGLGARGHAAIAAAAVLTVLANAWWLLAAFKFWHFITRCDYFGLARWWTILTDWLGLLSDTENQALMGMRTGWRIAVWALALLGLLKWRRERDGAFFPLALALGVLLAFSYLGRYMGVLRQIQPYRHVIPLSFLAVVPAAAWLAHAAREVRLRRLDPVARGLVIVLALVAVPHLVRDAVYFIPRLKPAIVRPEPGLPNISDTLGFGDLGWPDQMEYRHGLPRDDHRALKRWVDAHDDGSGRFLVQRWTVGEYLAWATKAQIIGGFRLINLRHGEANVFRLYNDRPPPAGYLRRYFDRYAVKYLIVSGVLHPIESVKELLKGIDFIPPHNRIYLVSETTSWFEKGSGVARASMNRIEVTEASGDEVVLRYHWLDTFVCRPSCRAEPYPVEGDPIGFIRVKNPPRHFVIENGY